MRPTAIRRRREWLPLVAVAVAIVTGSACAERAPTIPETFDLSAVKIAEFRDGKRGAASYTWDDGPASDFTVATIFEQYGLRASFYVIAGKIDDATWALWHGVQEKGHEVGNHSLNHLQLWLDTWTDEQLSQEIEGAQLLIAEKLGVKPLVFVFPFNKFSARSLEIALRTHVATRVGGPFVEGAGYRIWNLSTGNTADQLNAALSQAISAGAWFVAAGHGIDNSGYLPITSQDLRDHLQFASSQGAVLWVDTFQAVALYRLARTRLKPVVNATAGSMVVSLEGAIAPPLTTVRMTIEVPLLHEAPTIRAPTIRAHTDSGRVVPVVVRAGVARFEMTSTDQVQLELATGTN